MTRLTEYHRSALARCIMNDTPFPTPDEIKAQAQAALFAAMPDDMRAVAQAHPNWVKSTAGNFVTYAVSEVTAYAGSLAIAGLNDDQINKAVEPFAQQLIDRDKLQVEVENSLRAFSTVKSLLKVMPELEKYVAHLALPASSNLPAVANVVAKLSAAGWPKDKE